MKTKLFLATLLAMAPSLITHQAHADEVSLQLSCVAINDAYHETATIKLLGNNISVTFTDGVASDAPTYNQGVGSIDEGFGLGMGVCGQSDTLTGSPSLLDGSTKQGTVTVVDPPNYGCDGGTTTYSCKRINN